MTRNFATRLLTVTISITLLYSCKKASVQPQALASTPPAVQGNIDDSALLIARDVYLWYNQIPASFTAASYTDPNLVMTALRNYSIEPGFTGPVDRWSFGMKKVDWDNLSTGLNSTFATTNSTGDFGFEVFFLQEGDLRVKSVERASPAGLAGIHRSWRLTAINGNTNMTTGNSSFIIDNVYNATSSQFTFTKPDGTSVNITLQAGHYSQHPVYFDSVYTVNAKKVGYFVFNSFLGDTTEINNEFSRIFNGFSSQGVSDVVVDLRYNGGGYVSEQQRLADYLVSASANGGLMMKEQYNDKNSFNNESLYFQKQGSLNLSRVFFIVSGNTASASELLINNLKPYMNVQLIGPSHTHGKPVGFYPIPVGDWYIFPVSFRSTNKNGEGNYFNGLAVNAQVADGLDKDWGNPAEASLASALKYISTGSFRLQGEAPFKPDPAIESGNQVFGQNQFKGMVETRQVLPH